MHEITLIDKEAVSSSTTSALSIPSRLNYNTNKDIVYADKAKVDSVEDETNSGKTGDPRGERATSSNYKNNTLSDEVLVGVSSSIIRTS
jgi:hypothetical protein